MSRHVTLQRGFALIGALIALLLSSALAVADTPISHSGSVGVHQLHDTNAGPGVRCSYEEGGGSGEEVLYQLKVKPPVVFAVNKTGGRDKQLVGWRALIQRRNHGAASFVTIATGALHTAFAWDDTAATFPTPYIHPVNSKFGADLRARIVMYWYGADNTTVTGRATSEVDWYRKIAHSTSGNHDATLHNFCGDYYVE